MVITFTDIYMIVAMIGILSGVLFAYLGYRRSAHAVSGIEQLAVTVDGRLSELLEAREEAAHSSSLATGIETGVRQERDRAADIATAVEAAKIPPADVP